MTRAIASVVCLLVGHWWPAIGHSSNPLTIYVCRRCGGLLRVEHK